MSVLMFKSNPNLMGISVSNSFGDQVLMVVDISKPSPTEQRLVHPQVAGEIIYTNTESEGNWLEFSEQSLLNLISKEG